MRHANSGRKFDRDGSSRAAMFKNLVANLFAHERIETTVPKAKEVRRIAERMIAKVSALGENANKADIQDPKALSQRLALKRSIGSYLPQWRERFINGEVERIDVIEHLFREIAPRFVNRHGGYTRILKTRNRRGDNAELAIIELVERNPNVGKHPAPISSPASGDDVVRSSAPKTRSGAAAEASVAESRTSE